MLSANSQGRFHDPPASARPFDMNDLRMWARVCERRWERHGNHFQTGSPSRNMVSSRVTRPWTAHPLVNLPTWTCHAAPASAHRCLLLVLSLLRLPVLSSQHWLHGDHSSALSLGSSFSILCALGLLLSLELSLPSAPGTSVPDTRPFNIS